MGVRVGIQCFSNISDANDFFYSQQSIIAINKPDSSGYAIFQKDGNQWKKVTYDANNKVFNIVDAPDLLLPSCDPQSQILTGATLGLSVMSVFVIAWGYKQIASMFSHD